MMLRAEIYVIGDDNAKRLYGTCEKHINPQSVVSGICAFLKQCERFLGALSFVGVINLLEGREK
jgi:hypothetical protein